MKVGTQDPSAIEASAAKALRSDTTKAVRLYRKAAEIHEQSGDEESSQRLLGVAATALTDEGWKLRGSGDIPKARRTALRALGISPRHVDARNLLALIHVDNFEYDEAMVAYWQAIEAAVGEQGGAVKVKGVRYWDQIETRPYMRARHGYGFCLACLGRHREALGQFNLLLKLDPRDRVGARFLLADLYHFLDEREKAERYYKEVGSFDAPFTYALLLHGLGKDAEARLTLKRAFNKSPIARNLITDYLYCFVIWQTLGSYDWGTFPPIALHRNALETAWRANAGLAEDDKTRDQVEAAYNFCNFSGPLWLKYSDSYAFLKEGHPAG